MRRCQEVRATYKDDILRGQAVRSIFLWLGVGQIRTAYDSSYHHAHSVYRFSDRELLREFRHVCRPEGPPGDLQWR